jgi:hypothetical protein
MSGGLELLGVIARGLLLWVLAFVGSLGASDESLRAQESSALAGDETNARVADDCQVSCSFQT